MRFLLLVTSVLLATNFLYAADDVAEGPRQKMVKIQSEITNAKVKLAAAEGGRITADGYLAAYNQRLLESGCNSMGACRRGSTMSGADAKKLGDSIRTYSQTVSSADIEVKKIGKHLLDLNAQMASVEQEISGVPNQINETKATVASLNKRLALVTEDILINKQLADLKLNEANMINELDKIEKAWDKSTAGVYLQDKVGALLNSRLFCDAVQKKCLAPEKFVIDRENLKEIFPDISAANSRSGDNQRARGNSDKKPKATTK